MPEPSAALLPELRRVVQTLARVLRANPLRAFGLLGYGLRLNRDEQTRQRIARWAEEA